MRTSDYTEAPYQGVSQAPPQVRLGTQAQAITDWTVQVPAGAQPRPPFDYVGALEDLETDTFAHTFIDKAGVGQFILALQRDGINTNPLLFEIDGTPVAVTVDPAAQTYLDFAANPDEDLRLLTVEDFTFILNRKVAVANVATAAPTRPKEAMIWVRQAAYARTYDITVDPEGAGAPVTVTLKTPSGKEAEDGDDVDTTIIATALVDGAPYPVSSTGATDGATITGDLTSLTGQGYTVSRVGEIIYISHPTVDFTVTASDGQGGSALIVIKDRVQTFSDLPKRVPVDGFVVRITQQTGADNDDFFVKFRQTAGPGIGTWEETIEPGSNLGADPETLPVGLIYDEGGGTWSIEVLEWEARTVGNPDLAPDPGYVGFPLEDITFWKGRLGLMYAEGCRLSSATTPFRFYPSTLTIVLADDPVEVVNPLTKQADFRFALPFKTRLILWGRKAQAQVTTAAGQPATPQTISADPYSYYEFAELAEPQASNDRIYFVAPRGTNASAVYEMEVQLSGSSEVNESDDMSVSVPRFIPPGINRLATCPVNYLTVYGRSGDTEVTPHLYRYADRERVQNAWSRWSLPAECTYAGGFFDNTRFYLFALRDSQVYLLRLDTADGITDEGSGFLTRLDFRVRDSSAGVTRTYSSVTDLTTVTLPYPLFAQPTVMVAAGGGVGGLTFNNELLDAPEGTVAEVDAWEEGEDNFTLLGNWLDPDLIIGERMANNRIELSRMFYRDQSGRPNRSGQAVIKKLIFDLSDTAYLQVRVTIGGRAPRTYTFEASLWSTPGTDYDRVNLYTGEWSVPVGGLAKETTIEILTDQHLPASVLGYDVVMEVNPKATRIQTQ